MQPHLNFLQCRKTRAEREIESEKMIWFHTFILNAQQKQNPAKLNWGYRGTTMLQATSSSRLCGWEDGWRWQHSGQESVAVSGGWRAACALPHLWWNQRRSWCSTTKSVGCAKIWVYSALLIAVPQQSVVHILLSVLLIAKEGFHICGLLFQELGFLGNRWCFPTGWRRLRIYFWRKVVCCDINSQPQVESIWNEHVFDLVIGVNEVICGKHELIPGTVVRVMSWNISTIFLVREVFNKNLTMQKNCR